MGARRTYWHLERLQRKPSVYDISTSGLLYHRSIGRPTGQLTVKPEGQSGDHPNDQPKSWVAHQGVDQAISHSADQGERNVDQGAGQDWGQPASRRNAVLDVHTPVAAWIERYQRGSPLQMEDWEQFRDPRQTTYAVYTALQRTQEIYVDGLLRSTADTGHDARLTAEWLRRLERVLPVLRYPLHGLQMASAYVGQLAPSGRIVVTALMQTADEVRRIQRIAYRIRELQVANPDFGKQSRETWENDPAWQPLRALVERLLVTYDWGEALVALNLCVKPAFDDMLAVRLAGAAESHGDSLLSRLLTAFTDDCRWHCDWSGALIETAVADKPHNARTVKYWQQHWRPLIHSALKPLAAALDL